MNQKPNPGFHQNNKTSDIIKIFGIRDFIDKRESEANCLLCFTTFPLNEIEEHIESKYHKILHKVTDQIDNIQEGNPREGFSSSKKTDQKFPVKENAPPMNKDESNNSNGKTKKDTMPTKFYLEDYMKTVQYIKLDDNLGFLFNEQIFVEHSSFYFYEEYRDHLFCLRCDTKCNEDHQCHALYARFILIKMENEFIRELKRNKFHCGHCNLIKIGWETMKTHLDSKEHDHKRAFSRMVTYMVNNNIGDIAKFKVPI